MSLLTENKCIKKIFTEFTKGDKEVASLHIKNLTKLELAQLLINPHQYKEGYDVTFNVGYKIKFQDFVMESLRY